MTRRSIPGAADLGSDEILNTAYRLIWSALQEAPDTADIRLLLDAAHVASNLPLELQHKREAVFGYVQGLAEPQRSMLHHRLAGRNARQIAQLMEMPHKAVCVSLAEIYSDLQELVNRHLQ